MNNFNRRDTTPTVKNNSFLIQFFLYVQTNCSNDVSKRIYLEDAINAENIENQVFA